MKILLFLFLIFGLTLAANSQSLSEKSEETILSGIVYDDSGAVIPQAVIKIVGSNKKELITKTNEEGVFAIKLLPGNYSVQVESVKLKGFQIFKLEKYRIAPSYKGKMNLDIVLETRPCDDCGWIVSEPETIIKKQNNKEEK